jgi:hypothetical protein
MVLSPDFRIAESATQYLRKFVCKAQSMFDSKIYRPNVTHKLDVSFKNWKYKMASPIS